MSSLAGPGLWAFLCILIFPLKSKAGQPTSQKKKKEKKSSFPDNPDKKLTLTTESCSGFHQCLIAECKTLCSISSGVVLSNTESKLHKVRRGRPQLKLHPPQWQFGVNAMSSSIYDYDGIVSFFLKKKKTVAVKKQTFQKVQMRPLSARAESL